MTRAETPENTKKPTAAGRPISSAPAAPGKAISDSVCPAKLSRRRTMNHPVSPAVIATAVPAASALTMKGNCVSRRTSDTRLRDTPASGSGSVPMPMPVAVMGRRFRQADDEETAVAGAQDFDRNSVEPGQRLGGDHLVRPTDGGAPAPEVDDAIKVGQQRIDVVGHEQDGHEIGRASCRERVEVWV